MAGTRLGHAGETKQSATVSRWVRSAWVFGSIGGVFVIGVGMLALGMPLMLACAVKLRPFFFRGETLDAETPILVPDTGLPPRAGLWRTAREFSATCRAALTRAAPRRTLETDQAVRSRPVRHLVNQLRNRLTGASPAPDPFRTLELQHRLTRLSREIWVHSNGTGHEFANGFHSRAALIAYDRTLDESCQLAGVPVPEGEGSTRRLMAEATLSQAGWNW